MENIGYIVLAVVVVIAGYVIAVYNALVKLKNQVDEAWSDIDVQLKRRYDLIPNLINTVKGYASHESGTFEKVVAARSAAGGQCKAGLHFVIARLGPLQFVTAMLVALYYR